VNPPLSLLAEGEPFAREDGFSKTDVVDSLYQPRQAAPLTLLQQPMELLEKRH
jgi:hypothetical protein